ncbi:MAG: alpha-L-fucosidase [Candidatus Omnitrophica bacterium]|nr:alpha-L-fucosidase [Candidatus Omnitrophota bacterium]
MISYEKRIAWFNQARFGMFIHWGLYSLLGRGEWTMLVERIPPDEYAKLANQFNPAKFNADSWASLAKESGMKYMVLTARHHDGFCLYDSQVSDFTSVKTAAQKDFVAEYVKSCRKAGLKVGLYYSLMDWRFPGYFDRKKYPDSFKAMAKQLHGQVRELMTNYGKIDYLFYDGEWIPGVPRFRQTGSPEIAKLWRAKELNQMVRSLQPEIIINNRSGVDEDMDTPEQVVTASKTGRAWESCMTMGASCGWGYIKNNPTFKTTAQLIEYLVTSASSGGNYLLNIGPKPDGSVRKEEVTRLKEIGKWMKVNGESIYDSERPPAMTAQWLGGIIGYINTKGDNLYWHILRWPGKIASMPGIKNKVLSATIMATGQKVKIEQAKDGRLFLTGLPQEPPDKNDTVIKLKLNGKLAVSDCDGIPL